LQMFSRIELIDFAEDFYELIVRQEGTDIDRLKYPACEVLGLFVKAGSNTAERFHYGTDFVLDVNGDVQWIGAHVPSDRQIYSIYYRHHPVYRAIKAVHIDRYSQDNHKKSNIEGPTKTVGANTYVKMPEAWILKRDYLLERRDLSGSLLTPNVDYDPND